MYVRDTVTYLDISTFTPCITTPHATVHQGVQITGQCVLGSIHALPSSTFVDYLHAQCEGEKWVYQNINIGAHLQAIVTSLQQGNLRAVCDGSFDAYYGSAAWCIDGDGAIMRGVNLVPIGSDTMDATRCELAGIYTILRIIECIIQYFHIETASIEIGSDCESGLNRTLLNTDSTPLYYVNSSHLDMINAINHITRTSILTIKGRHISSHQADTCSYSQLDWWGQRNDDMDCTGDEESQYKVNFVTIYGKKSHIL